MKKYLFLLLMLLFYQAPAFSVPSNTLSITPAASDGTVIEASDENTRNNTVTTVYNAHDHNDIDQTANTLAIGDATIGNKTLQINNADSTKPYIRYDDTNNQWLFSLDGSNNSIIFAGESIVIHGNALQFEGSTNDDYETTLSITDPTADRTQTIQNNSGVIPLGTASNTLFFTTTGATTITLPTSGTMMASGDAAGGGLTGTYPNPTLVAIPAFSAYPSAAQSNLGTGDNTIVFGAEIFDNSNNFASNTFTAPSTGKYFLSTQVELVNIDTASTQLDLKIITSNRNYIRTIDPTKFSADVGYWALSLVVLADMDINDTAYVVITQTAGSAQTDVDTAQDTFFMGYLLRE